MATGTDRERAVHRLNLIHLVTTGVGLTLVGWGAWMAWAPLCPLVVGGVLLAGVAYARADRGKPE